MNLDLATFAPVLISAFAAVVLARFVFASYARPARRPSLTAVASTSTGGLEQVLLPLPRNTAALAVA